MLVCTHLLSMNNGAWRSLVARVLWEHGFITSIPLAPIDFLRINFFGRAQNAPKTTFATTVGVPTAAAAGLRL